MRYWETPAEFAQLNPSGLTPVLVETEGGRKTAIVEIRAILEHPRRDRATAAADGPRSRRAGPETRRLLQWFDHASSTPR